VLNPVRSRVEEALLCQHHIFNAGILFT